MDFDLRILNEFFSTETTGIINKYPFLEKFFTTILSTEKFRWDGYQTTSGKYSYLVNHLIGVAKIAKIMNLPEKYIFAAFLHDVCEIPFGDISVGLRNILIQKLKKLDYDANDAKLIVKYFKELQDQQGFSVEIENFLASFDITDIKDEKAKLIIKRILSGFLLEESPIVQFLEKIETNCLFLRDHLTDFTVEVFTSSFFSNVNYSLQFLPEILNSEKFDKTTKLNCIQIQVAFLVEFMDKCGIQLTPEQQSSEKFRQLKEILIDIQKNGLKQENFTALLGVLGCNQKVNKEIITETIPYNNCKTLFNKVQEASDYSYNLGSAKCRLGVEIFTELTSGAFQVFDRQVLTQKPEDEKYTTHEALHRLTSEQAATQGKIKMHSFKKSPSSILAK